MLTIFSSSVPCFSIGFITGQVPVNVRGLEAKDICCWSTNLQGSRGVSVWISDSSELVGSLNRLFGRPLTRSSSRKA